jgi:hypothetical protein
MGGAQQAALCFGEFGSASSLPTWAMNGITDTVTSTACRAGTWHREP